MTSRSVGEILQAKRETDKLSLAELSRLTKINRQTLERLEANQWQQLPDVAFIKGYIIAYARVLRFDPEPVLAILRRDYTQPANTNLKISRLNRRRLRSISPIRSAFLVVAGVILSYILLQWYWANQPPPLTIYTPETQSQVARETIVSGVTAPNAKVTVNEQQVSLKPDGSFETKITFPVSGLAAIVIQSQDQKGHVSEQVRYVQVKDSSP